MDDRSRTFGFVWVARAESGGCDGDHEVAFARRSGRLILVVNSRSMLGVCPAAISKVLFSFEPMTLETGGTSSLGLIWVTEGIERSGELSLGAGGRAFKSCRPNFRHQSRSADHSESPFFTFYRAVTPRISSPITAGYGQDRISRRIFCCA
jgi:hypothetical protein